MEGKKVLIIAHKPPYPKVDGGCIAIAQIMETFLDNGDTAHFLGMETKKHPSKPSFSHSNLHYQTIEVDAAITSLGALLNLVSRNSYFLARFIQANFEKQLISTLTKHSFDLIIFESLFTSPYINTVRKYSEAKIVYRSHNIEHAIWEMQEENEINVLKKAYLKFQVKRLKREELKCWNQVDTIASISEKDTAYIKNYSSTPTETIGMYCNTTYLTQKDQYDKLDFFHLGAMDWQPNHQGISWLLENVWQPFHQKNTNAELHIAGRGMSEKLINTKLPGLKNHKEVVDASQFISAHKVMLIPLFSGSGIRVKIIEGMAMGKCIISTSLGCEGINATHLENILIANTKEEFTEQMEFCLNNPLKVAEIGANARDFAQTSFSKSEIARQLKNLF